MKAAGRVIFTLLLSVGFLADGLSAQAPPAPCSLTDFPAPALCALSGLDTIPASYLFIVDESGSMRPIWMAVTRALAQFAEAIPEESELDVRLFATTTRELIPSTRSTRETRTTWASQLGTLAPPRGQHTDLGFAARAANSRLSSAPVDRLQFVFFLTDGIHDPGPRSPFPEAWSAPWDSLQVEAANLQRSRPINVGIVRLDPEADVTYLSRVFPEGVVTDAMHPAALQQWFSNLTNQAAVSKLQLLLRVDMERTLNITAVGQPLRTYQGRSTRQTLMFSSERQILSTVLPGGTEFSLPEGGRAVLNHDVTLHPGARQESEVQLIDRPYAILLPPGVNRRRTSGVMAVDTQLGPASELALIGANSDGVASVRIDLELAGGGFLPWHWWILSALGLTTAGGLVIRRGKWALHRAHLPGRLIIQHSEGPGAWSEEPIMFKGMRKKSYCVVHPNGQSSVQFDATSERGKTVVYASPAGNSLSVDGKKIVAPMVLKRVTRFQTENGDNITYLPS